MIRLAHQYVALLHVGTTLGRREFEVRLLITIWSNNVVPVNMVCIL